MNIVLAVIILRQVLNLSFSWLVALLIASSEGGKVSRVAM